jgi:dipeptidyl-peptidase 4
MTHFRFPFPLLLILFTGVLASAQPKTITLEDIWEKGTFQAKGGPRGIRFLSDGIHYSTQIDGKIDKIDLRTGNTTATLFDAATTTSPSPDWKKNMDDYTFSPDGKQILLSTNTQAIYRRSSQSDYFVCDLASKICTPLHHQPQQYATFSPNSNHVAWVSKNNLFVKNLQTGKTSQITTDGKINEIINGAADWCYEEEFELVRAFEWNPDGSKIAFLRFDEREVPEMTMERYNNKEYPELIKFKYPKVGEKNATVSAFIYDLASEQTVAVQTEAEPDDYLPRIAWTPKGELCITRLNRHQNHLRLLLANPQSGTCKTLMEEQNKCYLDLQEPHFLSDGSGFVWQSEKSGFNHLYIYDMKGKEKVALTKGNFDVTAFYGVDEKNNQVFFQAAFNNPMQREILHR